MTRDPEDERLTSGFMNNDYVLSFSISQPEKREALIALCEGVWEGEEVTDHTWEIRNDLTPDDMEDAILKLIERGDRVAYYYLTPVMASGTPGAPDAKRIFRVVIA